MEGLVSAADMDPPEPGHREARSSQSQQLCRTCCWGLNHLLHNRKVSQVCRYFQRGFCFYGDQCRCQHPQSPTPLEWRCYYLEPHLTWQGLWLVLTHRSSEPTHRPSVAAGSCSASAWQRTQTNLQDATNKTEELGGSPKRPLRSSSADKDHSCFWASQPKPNLEEESVALLQNLDHEDSQDVVCSICMEMVWDKPEAKRVFGILPNCSHAHCLSCLRTWHRNRWGLSRSIIKACPQCRTYSSYFIPSKFWVSSGPKKEQLIKILKAQKSQIPCRFFTQRNGYCSFKSNCIYLHRLPARTFYSHPASYRVSRLTMVGGDSQPEDSLIIFMDYVLPVTFFPFRTPPGSQQFLQ